MKHVVEIFDRETEALLFSVDVPADRLDALRQLMNWNQPGDEFDGYDLSQEQVKELEQWTGRSLMGKNHIVQLVCIE